MVGILTVSPNLLEGPPAVRLDAAKNFSRRCWPVVPNGRRDAHTKASGRTADFRRSSVSARIAPDWLPHRTSPHFASFEGPAPNLPLAHPRVRSNFSMIDSSEGPTKGPSPQVPSRREFLQSTGRIAAVGALAGAIIPQVHAAEGTSTMQVALVGCGGRGTGAAANALATQQGPIKLVAMADVFPNKLKASYEGLRGQASDKMDVPEDRKFIGFDGYKNAIDCLKPGDVAIFATPPAFRWVHFKYAIEKGVNVFMEKPLTVDGPTSQRMLGLAEESAEEESQGRRRPDVPPLQSRGRNCSTAFKDGEIGDITMLRAYRMSGPLASCFSGPKPKDQSELL